MSQASKKVEWCLCKAKKELKESALHRGLVEVEKNIENAEKHVAKAEHNLQGALYFDKGNYSDWSASAFFYCIYHCFLAILRKFGYESRNQECTIAMIEFLNEEGKIAIDKKFIEALKITEMDKLQERSVIGIRENYQYGTEMEFEERRQFDYLVSLCKEMIDETKEIIHKND